MAKTMLTARNIIRVVVVLGLFTILSHCIICPRANPAAGKEKIDQAIELYEVGKFEDALSIFDEAIDLLEAEGTDDLATAYFYKALCLFVLGSANSWHFIEAVGKASEINPEKYSSLSPRDYEEHFCRDYLAAVERYKKGNRPRKQTKKEYPKTEFKSKKRKGFFAIKGGWNKAKLLDESKVISSSIDEVVFNGGGCTFSIPFQSSNASFDIDLLYMPKGSKLGDAELEMIYYVIVPSLRITPFSGFYLLGGIEIGVLDEAVSKEDGNDSTEQDLTEFYEDTDICWNVGAGITIGHLFAEGRYSRGLRSIIPAQDDELSGGDGIDIRTEGIYLFLGLSF